MKSVIRSLIFVFISIKFTQYVIGAFDFGSNELKTYILITLALGILHLVLKPVLQVFSLPTKRFGFIFLSFIMTFVILYVLTTFVPDFSILPTSLSGLNIMGIVLPSKKLTSIMSGVLSAFALSTTFVFLESLCSKR